MRLASYNVENLFNRARAMNGTDWTDGKAVLDAYAKLNALLGEIEYTPAHKTKMIELMTQLGLASSDQGRFVILRQSRGDLVRRPRTGGLQIVANGRADWVGSLELRVEPVDEEAMRNTARVIDELRADVLGVVEAESRPALSGFNRTLIGAVGGTPFDHVMLIDGNDDRGIDVGLMTRRAFPIRGMRSHVDDRDAAGKTVFSRDCAEYLISTPSGATVLVMVNHFKSKGFGSTAASNAKRQAQAARVAAIYEERLAEGIDFVAVIGDFNDTPGSHPLQPLLAGSSLRDISVHPAFDDGGFPGTFGLCNAGNKIDYILLSPALFERVQSGGVLRKGMWPGKRPVRWSTYPSVTRPEEAASDHAAIWGDIDL
jgi:endonuclease/exonuclease/phosphatase family metal-dependent hydrolase